MRSAVSLVLFAVVAALPAAAGGAGSEARIVYRTVHLATPKRPPEVWSVLPSGRGRRLLTRGAEGPTWSPNRTRIAFSGTPAGIWVMRADGSARRRLTRLAGDIGPTWSPDGRRIAFSRQSLTSIDLWVVPATGGTAKPLLRTPVANELSPDWSPDGRRMAFQSSRGGEIQIWVMSLASKTARRLTSGSSSFSPDWAPDGRRIAYMTRGHVAVVDADHPRPRLLPSGTPLSVDSPAWSPDGTRIAFQRGGQVLTMRASGGDLRYVTRASWGTNDSPDW